MTIWTQDLQIFSVTILPIPVNVIYLQMDDTIHWVGFFPSVSSARVVAFL